MIRLYDYWRSSASYRVRIALNLAGIDYETVPVNLLDGSHKSSHHLARNPQGLVPVLEIDGLQLTQSVAIVEYLDETRGLNLLPRAPAKRARVRAVAHAVAMDIHPVCNLGVVGHVAELVPTPTARRDWMTHFIGPGLEAVETMLAEFDQAPFACGSSPSLADICLMPQVYNARRWGVAMERMPRIFAIEAACEQNSAFRSAYPSDPSAKLT